MLVEIRIQIIIYSSILNKETIYKISQKHLALASLKVNEIEHKMLKPLTFRRANRKSKCSGVDYL